MPSVFQPLCYVGIADKEVTLALLQIKEKEKNT